MLKGKNIELKPMTQAEVHFFFKQAIQSPFWYGEPYGDPIPTYDKFKEDFKEHYFDGSEPEKGRAFNILLDNRVVGEINYNQINRDDNSVELDVIIYNDDDKGKGYGPDALRTLVSYLFNQMNIELCWIDAVSANKRALKAYAKAGFKVVKKYYEDDIECVRFQLRKDS